MYTATISRPGCLPDSTEPPPQFDTTAEAWGYLAEERQREEEDADPEGGGYSETYKKLEICALRGATAGTVHGDTPGYKGRHDLGWSYCVEEVQP